MYIYLSTVEWVNIIRIKIIQCNTRQQRKEQSKTTHGKKKKKNRWISQIKFELKKWEWNKFCFPQFLLSLKASKKQLMVINVSCYHWDWGPAMGRRSIEYWYHFLSELDGCKTSRYTVKIYQDIVMICAFFCIYAVPQ